MLCLCLPIREGAGLTCSDGASANRLAAARARLGCHRRWPREGDVSKKVDRRDAGHSLVVRLPNVAGTWWHNHQRALQQKAGRKKQRRIGHTDWAVEENGQWVCLDLIDCCYAVPPSYILPRCEAAGPFGSPSTSGPWALRVPRRIRWMHLQI